jgi:hypothetical protein
MSTSELLRLIRAIKLPTDLLNILEDYVIDLKSHIPARDWNERFPYYVYMKPYLTLDTAGGIYNREPMKIEALKYPRVISTRKRARISKCFIYEYVRDNLGDTGVFSSLELLSRYIQRFYKCSDVGYPGSTYKINICHTTLVLTDRFFAELCRWILDSLMEHEEIRFRLQ